LSTAIEFTAGKMMILTACRSTPLNSIHSITDVRPNHDDHLYSENKGLNRLEGNCFFLGTFALWLGGRSAGRLVAAIAKPSRIRAAARPERPHPAIEGQLRTNRLNFDLAAKQAGDLTWPPQLKRASSRGHCLRHTAIFTNSHKPWVRRRQDARDGKDAAWVTAESCLDSIAHAMGRIYRLRV
jgi:hypothetical protein